MSFTSCFKEKSLKSKQRRYYSKTNPEKKAPRLKKEAIRAKREADLKIFMFHCSQIIEIFT
jgi:hypothetical protein